MFNKIYPIIIGKFYGMTQTGYYTQADKYQDIASSLISNIFRSVAFPVFSKVQDDLQRLKRIFHFSYHAVDGRRFVSAHIDHVERAMGSVRAVFPLALFFGNMLSVYYFVFRFVQ